MNPLRQDRLRLITAPWLIILITLIAAAALMAVVFDIGAHGREWLSLVVRWLHIMYGVAWIGASLYFIFLENALEREDQPEELAGSMYSLHGGGIYYLEKYKTAPKPFPKTIHWFKWDAYLTWVTGFLMMIIVYYSNPKATLLEAGSSLPGWLAVVIGVGALLLTWLVYVALSRTALLANAPLFALLGLLLFALAAFLLSLVFSGRGAYIHIGGMIGTIMTGNVLLVIIPSQKALLKAVQKGETLDPEFIKWVQLRSRHNNYLTLPVLFTMISNHYPLAYSHGLNWLILIVLFLAGTAVRHAVNVTEKEHHRTVREGGALPHLYVVAVVLVIALVFFTAPRRPDPASTAVPVTSAEAYAIISLRCSSCHTALPSQPGFATAPAGVLLVTPEQVQAQLAKIKQVAVDSSYMPLGNITGMTDEERATLRRWIAQGAATDN